MADTGILANRRAVVTVFSRPSGLLSHMVRLLMQEKNIANVDVQFLKPGDGNEDLASLRLDPRADLPVLIDRNLVLSDTRTILEYVDERFPHPPLMPIDPTERAQARQAIELIRTDYYNQANVIENGSAAKARAARKELQAAVTGLVGGVEKTKFWMNDEFSLVDCALAPLLWRLNALGIKLPASAAPLKEYAERLCARPAFVASLTEVEEEFGA